MTQMWQPGSVAIFLGAQDVLGADALFLGVGVTAPETEFRPKFMPVHNDFGGTQIEADSGFGGEEGFIAVDMARWDYQVLNEMADYPGFDPAQIASAAGNRGNYPFGFIGSLMQTEGLLMTLFLLNTNMLPGGAPTLYVNQPKGFRFPCAKCVQNTLPKKPLEAASTYRLAFHCTNLFSFVNGLPNWQLYDENMANLPSMS